MLVSVLLVAVAMPVVAWTAYLGLLTLASFGSGPWSAERTAPSRPVGEARFDVVVPAHDEELGIAETVHNLVAIDYPAGSRRVVVVADNCKDATASRAREAGAIVIERQDEALRGKGYALKMAFERSMSDAFADAVVVVDADTHVSPNLLRAFEERLRRGASAIQAEYRVSNPEASWRTRLMRIGFALFHDVRSRGRERLGASAGLRGNGMAFSIPVLKEVPHEAFSIVEDVEYGIRLGLAGHRVHYAGDAQVYGEMVSTESASRSQRRRWEGGRTLLARRHAWPLLGAAMRRGSFVLLDLWADLLVPPLTYVVLAAATGSLASVAWVVLGHGAWWSLLPWAFAGSCLCLYVGRGIQLANVGARVVLDLAWAPVYMAWKVALAMRPQSDKTRWVRTTREGEKP